jgi:small GTP-binding protein
MSVAPIPKVVLIGSANVGKTALFYALQNDGFVADRLPTVGVDHCTIERIVNGTPVAFRLTDTAGQEQYRSFTKTFFRGADAAIITFSLTNVISFQDIQTWHNLLLEMCPTAKLFLVGNMVDLPRVIDFPDAQERASDLKAQYSETSAKTGAGVTDLLNAILHVLSTREQPIERLSLERLRPATKRKGCC